MKKHTILFLAANPSGADRLALEEEARAIQVELERSGFRDCFELETRWAARPLDLLRELRKLKPTVVHFSGRGGRDPVNRDPPNKTLHQDTVSEPSQNGSMQQYGLFFQGPDGRVQFVSTAALEETFGAAGSSVKLVVLNACYSEVQAEALLTHVDCIVGMSGSIRHDAAKSFAIGFYGGLGECESVAAAYKQGCAAIRLEGLPDSDRPRLKLRTGADASQLVLAAGIPVADPAQAGPGDSPGRRVDARGEARQPRVPERHHVFVGRTTELEHMGAAFDRDGSGRVALVALQGMAGVGKTYLAHEFYARHPERFGSYQHIVLDPERPKTVAAWMEVLGEQAGIDEARVNERTVAEALRAQRALVHVDNVDSAAAAGLVADLADALDGVPMLVTGRYGELGTAAQSSWTRIELAPLDPGTALALLQAELEGAPFAVPEAELRELVRQVAGLPLALHLAAGYLRRRVTVDRFLERLRAQGLALGSRDPGDHVRRDRARGVLSTSFAISRELLLAEAGARAPAWSAALVALGWAPRKGFGPSLGAAITGLDEASGAFEDFMDAAAALSLVRWLRPEERADAAWAVHPLLGEFLRAGAQRPEIDERIGAWVAERFHERVDRWMAEDSDERWKLFVELEAVGEWLGVDTDDILVRFIKRMHH
ncbi:MAG TPA: NB-ARC domain-containing protein [Kofleriaceae bacterium]|nr:NB-ARC domain-containing protein [Kofleriaceae bacterium]